MGMEIKSIKTKRCVMKYFTFGEGNKNLILIPGVGIRSITMSSDMVAAYYAPFHKEYKVYVFDIREDLPHVYTIDEMMEDLYQAITDLGIKKAYFNGCSMGGMILQRMEVKHPDIVLKAVLSSTVCEISNRSKKVIENWRDLTVEGKLKELAEVSCKQVYTSDYYEKYYDALIDYHINASKEETKKFIIQLDAILKFNNRDVINTKPKTLVVTAKGDQTFSYTEQEDMAKKIGGKLLTYEGYSHAVYDEALDYLEKIKNFFEED